MKLHRILAAIFLFTIRIDAYPSTENQCLIDRKLQSTKLSDKELKEITDCFKEGKCDAEKTEKMCQWARAEKALPTFEPPPHQKKQIEEICNQCDQIAIIACGTDFYEAQKRFDIIDKIFLSDANRDKPLMLEFSSPEFRFSNLNVYDNIAGIESDRASYQTEYDKLHAELAKLSNSVPTETAVVSNIKNAHNLISNFENRWMKYFQNIERLKDLFRRSNAIIVDWQLRLLAMKAEPYCQDYVPQIDLAAKDSINLSSAFEKVIEVIKKSNTRYDLIPLTTFTENAIKLQYVKTSKTRLEDLDKSIGAVLRLDSDFMQSNIWWYKTSVGGLASGLHTRYYQYREPLRLLTIAAVEGQGFINAIKGNTSAPVAAANKAISTIQQRIKLINDDILWLKSRGWQGQFNDQKMLVQSWAQSAKTDLCKKALATFVEGSSKVSDDVRDFESLAEPKFLNAMKVCEAAE